jgi:AcrR family transcriptional regulator
LRPDDGIDGCNREHVNEGVMGRIASTATRPGRQRVVRAGRPPRELAGEVDARILDAAQQVFLERGLEGASVDEIAALARAGKPSIYARFPGKEALYTAVVMRNVAANIARFESHVPTGTTLEERLASAGAAILEWVLTGGTFGLMRLAIAEARRFPDLAISVYKMARERGTEAVARLLGEMAQSGEFGPLPAFAAEQLPVTTTFFLDLVLLPLLLRGLMGENLTALRAEIDAHVARSVAFFLAACRHGGSS